ncbi:PREDICTED: zinc finger BED domain-containing protein 4-like [Branchiostoma belcheri]|uniref:Zinc finger BED domain-containing protein 4-like n=1 Tax=Branchiostoma belcheri TaxID=7741 RepID=A0A6P4YG11_BRABE|nr:PREDICTED: zinc finger BED domain-containing protein 4-like [Branchiostoma belcheri]
MYDVALKALKSDLSDVECAALTGDGWTSRATDHFLTITVHYIKDWQLNVKVLQTLKADVAQTGENIGIEIEDCLKEFGLTDKVEVMTTDNAKSMVNATQKAGVRLSMGCFAHTLNLSTQKVMAVESVSAMISMIRPAITYFRSSYMGKIVLKEKQTALHLPEHRLLLDCKTRWNSTYLMLERFQTQYPAIVAASMDERLKNKEGFKKLQKCDSDTVEKIQTFLRVMKIPYLITVAMSAEKRPTCGQVLPMMDKLRKHLSPDEEADDAFACDIKAVILSDLETRYQDTDRVEFLEEASAMDPRFKGMATDEVWERVVTAIDSRQEVHVKKEPNDVTFTPTATAASAATQLETKTQNEEVPAKLAKLSAMEEIFVDDDDDVEVLHVEPPLPVRVRAQQEVHTYKNLPKLRSTDDIVAFWKERSLSLPLLSGLAKRYLVVPGTSVPSERVFSTAGDLVSAERACLDPDNVNVLLFLNKNT